MLVFGGGRNGVLGLIPWAFHGRLFTNGKMGNDTIDVYMCEEAKNTHDHYQSSKALSSTLRLFLQHVTCKGLDFYLVISHWFSFSLRVASVSS